MPETKTAITNVIPPENRETIKENKNTETIKEETKEGEAETEENLIQLGECRKHPATPVPIVSKDGKRQIGAEMFGGIKSMVVYEFPQCVGEECSSDWCSEHQCCINICKHDHVGYYDENNPEPISQ